MLGFAGNKCNSQYKFLKDNVNNEYLISVFAHNAQNFDNSFLIKALNNIENATFSALPRNSNKFISLKIENFIFKDSFLFLNKSLDYLTKTIDDEDRISLKQEFGENYELLTKKGIYPYDRFDCKEKYNKTKIPNHSHFKNKLNNNRNRAVEGNNSVFESFSILSVLVFIEVFAIIFCLLFLEIFQMKNINML